MWGSRSSTLTAARCSDRSAKPPSANRLLASADLRGQPQDEPGCALGLGALDDGATVRQPGERQQCTVSAVDAVEVHVGGRAGTRQRPGDRAQGLRATAPWRADDVQMIELREVEDGGSPRLLGGHVLECERRDGERGGALLHRRLRRLDVREQQTVGQGGKPGAELRRDTHRDGCGTHRFDEHLQVGDLGVGDHGLPRPHRLLEH